MNRAGQPPQRTPTSLGPNPALGAPFRNQYTNYGIPPRNAMAGFHPLGNHRAAQNIVAQPSPNYLQQPRAQSTFPFGGSLPQQQQQSHAPLQHTPQTPLPQTPLHQTQPQTQPSSNVNATTLPPHLTQTAISNIGPAPSVSSTSEVGLDPNDFPALGSTPANNLNTPPSASNTTSYATQAGTGVGAATGQGGNGASQQRDFTPDDFPALGGGQTTQSQATVTQQQATTTSAQDGHPPGLNGFQQNDQHHRQSLLGSLAGGQQQPGLLNIGQARGAFQSEAEKRNYALKLNQNNLAAVWNSPNANPSAQTTTGAFGASTTNGAPTQLPPSSQTQPQAQTQTQIGAPPGVPPPSFSRQQSQQQQTTSQQQQVGTPYIGNGVVGGGAGVDAATHPSQGSIQPSSSVPQTPAQQVLMSPADKWGLLALLDIIRSPDLDQNLIAMGTDLGTMGLDMQTHGSLYTTFITPWADQVAAHTVEPDFHLPACYQVAPPPPGPGKAQAFSDETLFFMFYSSPKDALQEVAAQELFNRNWRFHKELRLWITKESGTSPSQKIPGGERGTYTIWDHEVWGKDTRTITVLYTDLEEKNQSVFAHSQTLQLASAIAPTTPAGQQQQQGQGQQGQQGQMLGARVGGFQQMGIAAI